MCDDGTQLVSVLARPFAFLFEGKFGGRLAPRIPTLRVKLDYRAQALSQGQSAGGSHRITLQSDKTRSHKTPEVFDTFTCVQRSCSQLLEVYSEAY